MANDMAKRLMARVKAFRQALGLSQEAFAERAGLKYKYYQHVEAGRKRDIRLSTLQKLAKACGVGLPQLFDFDAAPMVVAEDRPKDSSEAAPSKSGRKSSKRR